MKTAISIPDPVFLSADELARRLGMSRSELYATAVQEFVAKHRDEDVTRRLNEIYDQEQGGLAPDLRKAQARSVGRDEW